MAKTIPECGVWQQVVAWPPSKKYKDFKEVERGELLVEERNWARGGVGLYISVKSQKTIK